MSSTKSPGINGLQPIIWRKIPELGEILLSTWTEAVNNKTNIEAMRTGLLKLIPKQKGGDPIDSFRPITLLNYDYTIIFKMRR
jgi:hypothetical protein